MNTEPVRTNGAIAIAIIMAVVGSATAFQAALVELLTQMSVNPDLARSIGTMVQVFIMIAGSAVTIWKTGERTRSAVTSWSPTMGAATPGPADDPHLELAAATLQGLDHDSPQEEILIPDLGSDPSYAAAPSTPSWEPDLSPISQPEQEPVYDPISGEPI